MKWYATEGLDVKIDAYVDLSRCCRLWLNETLGKKEGYTVNATVEGKDYELFHTYDIEQASLKLEEIMDFIRNENAKIYR